MAEDLGTCDAEASGVSRAVVGIRLVSGGEVRFCAHHYERNADKLFEVGAEMVTDLRQETLYMPV